jgi:glucosamine--fructose-6-phosphate aminotransferase (isomerizing)
MCGIVGYIGTRQAVPLLVDGLRRLEYRGYDSAGVALHQDPGVLQITRTTGRVQTLESKLGDLNGSVHHARVGIGHTRWATHGRPTEENAHPHKSSDGKVVAVHNGIFENFNELRAELVANGITPRSQTDTECFPLMLAHLMDQGAGFEEAFRAAVKRMQGMYALACLHADHPGKMLLARSGPSLIVGVGQDEYFVASDVAPLLPHTRDVVFLEDGDIAELTHSGMKITDRDGRTVVRSLRHVDWDASAAELCGHRHYMHKEILEQPEALARTVGAHLEGDDIALGLPFSLDFWRDLDRVVILACGTSWHAGLVAKAWIERYARVPVEVDYASEYRCRKPIVSGRSLAIAITQSGETADTLAALKEAASGGAHTLSVCNVKGSQATRLAEGGLLTHAGPEIGVASTKAFTTQLAVLAMLALHIGRIRGSGDERVVSELVGALRGLPRVIERIRAEESKIEGLAAEWTNVPSALYLGRGRLYPIALEGALKMKEISYIHAEGYPAGEMKHGPIALIHREMPVVALMPHDENRDRMLSNLQEASARDGQILALVSEGDHALDSVARSVIELPAVHPILAPILYTVPLQLLAYHVALLRGCDVDRPRNLAKSVTVE